MVVYLVTKRSLVTRRKKRDDDDFMHQDGIVTDILTLRANPVPSGRPTDPYG